MALRVGDSNIVWGNSSTASNVRSGKLAMDGRNREWEVSHRSKHSKEHRTKADRVQLPEDKGFSREVQKALFGRVVKKPSL